MERLRQRWGVLTPSQRAELDLAGLHEPTQLASLFLTELAPGGGPSRSFTDDRPYCKPMWETASVSSNALAASIERLLGSERGPRLVGATDVEQQTVQERRALLVRMAHKGTSMGPFRFLNAP
jgi:hypothetical protein